MKIICIGRNYIDHALEMGKEVPTDPVFFLKPDSAILPKRNPFYIPDFSNEIHYEVELVVRINRLGKSIAEKFAHQYYNEVGLGIDFTARDVQEICKEKGLPWEKAKAFDQSAVISQKFHSINEIKDISFELHKNGEIVQKGNSNDMVFNINTIIAYVSKFMTLKIGDLIFTGTPAGVGPVTIGDKLEGFQDGEKMFEVKIK